MVGRFRIFFRDLKTIEIDIPKPFQLVWPKSIQYTKKPKQVIYIYKHGSD